MEKKSKYSSPEEQRALVREWKAGDVLAGHKLFKEYETFIDIRARKKAQKFPNSSFKELQAAAKQAFFIGLMRYKPEKGGISTCVEWSIMDELNRATRFNNISRGPRSDKARKICHAVQEELKKNPEWNTPYSQIFQSVAETLDMKPALIRRTFEKATARNMELDANMNADHDKTSKGDMFVDDTVMIVESIEKKQMGDKLRTALEQLNPRYKDIVMRLFGLGETAEQVGEEETLGDVCEDYDVSRQRIDQLKTKALLQLKNILQKEGIGSSDGDFSPQGHKRRAQALEPV